MRNGVDLASAIKRFECESLLFGISVKSALKNAPPSGSDPEVSISYRRRTITCSEETLLASGHHIFSWGGTFRIRNGNPSIPAIARYTYSKSKVTALNRISHTSMSGVTENEAQILIDKK